MDTKEGEIIVPVQLSTFRWHDLMKCHLYNIMWHHLTLTALISILKNEVQEG